MLKKRLQDIFLLIRPWLNHSLVRQYGSNAAWMTVARIYWMLSSLFVGILVARTLGPYHFGILNYAMAFTGMFAFIIQLSVNNVIIRQLLEEPEKEKQISGAFSLFRGMLFCLMMVSMVVTLNLTRQTDQVKILCLIIAFGYIGYITQPAQLYFTATVQNKYLAIGQITSCTFSTVIRLVAIMGHLSLYWYAVAEMAVILVPGFVQTYFYCRRVGSPLRWEFDFLAACRLFKPALLLSFSGVLTSVYAQTDLVMLKYFLGPESVGYYAIATKITENGFEFGLLLSTVFFPVVVSASKVSVAACNKQLHRLYFLFFWVMVFIAVLIFAAGYPLIYYLYGKDFLPAVRILFTYGCTLPGGLILVVFTQWSVNENLLKTNMAVLTSGVAINIILNYLSIPHWGMMGAALSSIVAMLSGLILVLLFSRKGRKHLRLIFLSLFTLPSFKLGEHDMPN